MAEQWEDVTPEELAMLNGSAPPAPKAKGKGSRWVDVTPEELAMLNGEPSWTVRGAKKRPDEIAGEADAPIPGGDKPYPKADIPGALTDLRTANDKENAKTTRGEAFGQGLVKGATANQDAAIAGIGQLAARHYLHAGASGDGLRPPIGEPATLDDYRKGRDARVATNEKAAKDQPGWNTAGQVVGSLAPIPGPKGAGLLGKAGRALGEGALYSAGESKADLTKGEFSEFATDVAKGAGAAAVTSGALSTGGKVLGGVAKGAGKRVDDRIVSGLTEGGTRKQQTKILGEMGLKRDELLTVAKETPGLAKAASAKKATKTLGILQGKLDELKDVTRDAYDAVDKADPGVGKSVLLDKLEAVRKSLLSKPQTTPLADVVQKQIDSINTSAWGSREHIGMRELREFASDLGDDAFRTVGAKPRLAESAKRDVYNAITGTIEQHIDAVGKKAGLDPSTTAVVRAANRKMGILINVKDAVKRRAEDESKNKTSFTDRMVKMGGAAIGLGGLAAGSVAPALGAGAAAAIAKTAPMARRGTDRAVAWLAKASESGSPAAIKDALEAAIQAGVPRVVATRIAAGPKGRDRGGPGSTR